MEHPGADDQGEKVTESSVLIPAVETAASGDMQNDVATYPILITEDLNLFPAGKYSLYVSAGVRDKALVRRPAGSFSVAWDMRTWEVARRDFIQEAKFLLDEKDFKSFAQKSIGEQEARDKFGFLLDALKFGCPPHGGIAFGLDRLVMLMTGATSIREVMAFPKTQTAACPLTQAPSSVAPGQLIELGIHLHKPPETDT